jgi:hypothetical protein
MVAKYKLTAQEFEINYTLLALHTGVEDYTLAYHLNKVLKMSFERQKKDLVISDDSSVAVFNCEDEKNQSNWYLISNKALVEQEANEADLFVNQPIKKSSYLIPERKEVDYFVKIEDQDQSDLNELIQKIKSIPDIVTAYSLDYTGLKSKQNLIF